MSTDDKTTDLIDTKVLDIQTPPEPPALDPTQSISTTVPAESDQPEPPAISASTAAETQESAGSREQESAGSRETAAAIYIQVKGVGKIAADAWSASLSEEQAASVVACRDESGSIDALKLRDAFNSIATAQDDQKAVVETASNSKE